MLTVFRELLVNLAATVVADLSSPTGMIGYIFGIGLIVYWLVSWHRKRASQGKRGVGSWYFIALAFFVAATAIGAAAYGIGLRSSNTAGGGKTGPQSPEIA